MRRVPVAKRIGERDINVHQGTVAGSRTLRGAGSAFIGVILIGALVAPGAAIASGTPPVATTDAVTTSEDTPVTGNLLANDTDAESDPLTVTSFSQPSPAVGSIAIYSNGDFTFTPAANWNGAVQAWYRAFDGTMSTQGWINITVTPVNDLPVATKDAASGTEDMKVVLTSAVLTANDTDVEGSALTVDAVTNATGGTAVVESGTVTFTPTANLCGKDVASFDYSVTDGTGTSGLATVTISLTCVNDPPLTVADTATVLFNTGAADYDVLANDSDVEGDTLTLEGASVDATAGTASVVAGEVRFTPRSGFYGDAVITYTASDGTDTTDGTLTVTVGSDITAPVPTAPVVTFGTGRVDETAPILISWSATDEGVGVGTYEVEASVGGAPFSTIYLGAATSVTKMYPFAKKLVWRVRAADLDNNTSDWVTSAARSIAAYQSPPVTGTWASVTSSGSSGTGYRYTATLGRYAQLTFKGREVLFVAPKNAKSGYARVYVDGAYRARVTLYRSRTALGQIITRYAWGTSGSHTLRVANYQSGKRTNVDAFVVLR